MDVAPVVAGDVLAQGVEGDVGAGQVLGDGALDVAQDAVQDRAQTHGARVDVDVLRGAQGAFALEQSHRIALDRQDRPHGDDAATLGGQDEAALVDGRGVRVGTTKTARPGPTGISMREGSSGRVRGLVTVRRMRAWSPR